MWGTNISIDEVHFSQNTWNIMRAHQPCCQKQWQEQYSLLENGIQNIIETGTALRLPDCNTCDNRGSLWSFGVPGSRTAPHRLLQIVTMPSLRPYPTPPHCLVKKRLSDSEIYLWFFLNFACSLIASHDTRTLVTTVTTLPDFVSVAFYSPLYCTNWGKREIILKIVLISVQKLSWY